MSDSAHEDELRKRAQKRVGSTLKGKYTIDRVLGIGGMAVVYAVTHRNQAELALKMLHPELGLHGDVRTRFLREGYAANSVKHPGVVMVVDDDVAEDGSAFLVMERLHGDTVEAVWEEHGLRLPLRIAAAVVDQLLDVLSAAHAKDIVHRDIKPANLFLTDDGTVKVLDFGIARARDALASSNGQQTGSGIVLGTPAFMAPEQALAKTKEIDQRTDVWAAGATLFSLVAGQLVHVGSNAPQLLVQAATENARSLAAVAPDAPPAFVDVVARALAFEREDRYPTAKAMQAALRDACRECFGDAPKKDWLARENRTPPREHVRISAGSLGIDETTTFVSSPDVAGAPSALVGGTTTAAPISSEQIAKVSSSRRRAATIALAAVTFVLVAAVAFDLWVRPSSPPIPEATASTPSSAAPTPSAAPIEIADTPSASAAPSATASTLVPVHAAHAHPVGHSLGSKPGVKPGCETPFYYDAKGRKIFKPECL